MSDSKSATNVWGARFLLVSSFLFMVVMNIIANTGAFGGTTAVVVSEEYPTPITPAGYAFSIWGLVWSFVAIFVIYFVVNRSAQIDSLPWCVVCAFVVNCIANGLWTMLFCYRLILISFLDIVVVVGSTAYLYMSFYPGRTSAFPQFTLSYWCRGAAWSLYLGWQSVATLLSLCTVFTKYNIGTSPDAQNLIAIAGIALAGFLGLVMIALHEDILSVGVFLWAFVAIAVKHNKNDVVLVASLMAGGACLGLILSTIAKHVLKGRSTAEYMSITSAKHVSEESHL